MNNFIAIIPARGDSKRILKKNLSLLNGKPLISYAIIEAKKSQHIKRLIVSTDNKEIADYAVKLGAEVPFLRPKRYAGDDSPIIDTLYLIYLWSIKNHLKVDGFVLLQPTSPFRTVEHIDECIAIYKQTKADTVISVREVKDHPYWVWRYTKKQINPLFSLSFVAKQKNQLPLMVCENGAVMVIKQLLIKNKRLYGKKNIPYLMDSNSSLDINTPDDLLVAELILRDRK